MARPRSDIQERILEVAREQFLRLGVDGASLRTIAKEAGTSIGMVYYYFPTKDDLFLGVVEEVYVGLIDRLQTALADDSDYSKRVFRLYSCYGQYTELERQVIRLIVKEALGSRERLERLVERFQRGHLPMIMGLVLDGFQKNKIDPSFHPLTAMICLGAIGVLPQLVTDASAHKFPWGMPEKGEKLARQLAEIFLRGVAPR